MFTVECLLLLLLICHHPDVHQRPPARASATMPPHMRRCGLALRVCLALYVQRRRLVCVSCLICACLPYMCGLALYVPLALYASYVQRRRAHVCLKCVLHLHVCIPYVHAAHACAHACQLPKETFTNSCTARITPRSLSHPSPVLPSFRAYVHECGRLVSCSTIAAVADSSGAHAASSRTVCVRVRGTHSGVKEHILE